MRQGTLAVLWLLLAGCDPELSIAHVRDHDAGTSQPSVPVPFACDQRGPLFASTDSREAACGEASLGFHHALCSCSDVVTSMPTEVDGFDSRVATYAPGQTSGTLTANGGLFASALRTGGSVLVAGPAGIPLQANLTIGGNLFDRGQLQGAHEVSIAGDARIAGDVRVRSLQVSGALRVAPTSALEVTTGAPNVSREAIDSAPPCRCDAALEVPQRILAARRDNDNARIGLDLESGLKAFSTSLDLRLPCGRYFVAAIHGQRDITLRIEGRVALFVEAGIVMDTASALTVELAPQAELDLFVGNGISAGGDVRIGDPADPTRTRLFFAGPDTLFFAGETMLAASLHAPTTGLVNNRLLTLYGGALVRHLAASGPLALHYDRALARDPCSEARCSRNEDCASTLRCDHGACLP